MRGFGPGYNLVTLNGRALPTASIASIGQDQNGDFVSGTTRSFDFSNIASEGVSSLVVYKTARASVTSGGIGAAIDIVTRKPLDGQLGFTGSIGAKAVYDQSDTDFARVTPEVSGLLNWVNDDSTFGIGLFGSFQQRNNSAPSATVNDWNIETFGAVLRPEPRPRQRVDDVRQRAVGRARWSGSRTTSACDYSEFKRERINGQLTLQFAPSDAWQVTADATYYQNQSEEQRTDQATWLNRPFSRVEFDGNPDVATATSITDIISGAKDGGFEQQYRAIEENLLSLGLNAQFQATDDLTVHARRSPFGSQGAAEQPARPFVDAGRDRREGRRRPDAVDRQRLPGPADHLQRQPGDRRQRQRQRRARPARSRLAGRAQHDLAPDPDDRRGPPRRCVGPRRRRPRRLRRFLAPERHAPDPHRHLPDARRLGRRPHRRRAAVRPGRGDAVLPDLRVRPLRSDGDRRAADRLPRRCHPALHAARQPLSGLRQVNGNQDNAVDEEIWAAYAQVELNTELAGRPVNIVAGVRYEHTNVDLDFAGRAARGAALGRGQRLHQDARRGQRRGDRVEQLRSHPAGARLLGRHHRRPQGPRFLRQDHRPARLRLAVLGGRRRLEQPEPADLPRRQA